MTQTALAVCGSEQTVLDVPFVADEVDVDDIVPYADADVDTALQILETRRHVGELLFAREEDLAIADVADLEAGQQEARAGTDRQLTKMQTDMLQAQARRNRILAARGRFRARHRELEILTHLRRGQKEGE